MTASPVHEEFKGLLAVLIRRKLDLLMVDDHKDNEIMRATNYKGSPLIPLQGHSERCPDLAFDSGEDPPTFVAEIAHSQKGETDFAMIAEQYISGTDGAIKTMLGINMEYRTPEKRKELAGQPRKVSYQIFHCHIKRHNRMEVIREEPRFFQDAEGVVDPDTKVPLTLADLTQSDDLDLSVFNLDITHRDLSDVMEAAEAKQARVDNRVVTSKFTFVSELKRTSEKNTKESSSPELDDDKTSNYRRAGKTPLSGGASSATARETRASVKTGDGGKNKRAEDEADDAGSRRSKRNKGGK